MSSNIIAIDFCGKHLSMVLVTYGRDGYRLAACEQVRLTDDDQWTDVAAVVNGLLDTVDMRDVACVAALPDEWVFHRLITVPFADRKKIGKIIAFEMEPLLPFAVQDMIIDFQPLASARPADGETELYAAAVSKERLKNFIDHLSALGLEPEIITSRSFALASVLSVHVDTGLFVDGDADRLIVGGFDDSKVRFVHPATVVRASKSPAEGVAESLRHVLVAEEERRSADFNPRTVYVTDRLLATEGLKTSLENVLGVTVSGLDIADAFGLQLDGCVDDTGQVSRGFDVALGLALLKRVRGPFINFRKEEYAVTGKWRQYSDIIIKTGAIAALVVIVGLSGFYYDLKNTREQISAIRAHRAVVFQESFPKVPLVDDPLIQMRAESSRLKGKIGLPPEMDRKADCVDMLYDISRLIPGDNDVVIDRLMVGPDDVVLSGTTGSFNAVDSLKSEFGKSDYFGKIDISSATMSKVDKRVSFKLRLELR